MSSYIPQKGDFIVMAFDPHAGHEQRGRRPALVISNTLFNQKAGLAIVCPVTNTDRANPLHVPVPKGYGVSGVVLVDHMKSVDCHARKAGFLSKAPQELVNEVLAILETFIYEQE